MRKRLKGFAIGVAIAWGLVLYGLLLAGCPEQHQLQPCKDTMIQLTGFGGVAGSARCPSPDHVMSFHVDTDRDDWLVCKCPRTNP
jgi:hypothetical protein